MAKCFFNDCNKEVNKRGKFCKGHDLKKQQAAADLAVIFGPAAKRAAA